MYIRVVIKQILTILIAIALHFSVSNIVSTTPDEAVNSFMDGVKSQQEQVMEKYMDNRYINFICNVQGDEKVVQRMREALFKNFSYDIIEVGEKNDVAVAKVLVKRNDFSQVKSDYDTASYKYIMDNLYSDDIGDKETLSAECLDIYVQQMEKAAAVDIGEPLVSHKKDESETNGAQASQENGDGSELSVGTGEGPGEAIVYIPMVDDGYYGWNLLLSDEVMKTLLGGLEIPGQQ